MGKIADMNECRNLWCIRRVFYLKSSLDRLFMSDEMRRLKDVLDAHTFADIAV